MTSPSPTTPHSSFSRPDVIRSDRPRRTPGRLVTVLAVGFLLLDAALLAVAGIWGGGPVLVGGSVLCFALVAVVLVLRRRYVRQLAEISRARAALRQELRSVTPSPDRERTT